MTEMQETGSGMNRERLRTYAEDDEGWKKIQRLLPDRLQLAEGELPVEDWLQVDRFTVHVDRWTSPDAPASLILLHGAGGNGRLVSAFGVLAARAGYDVVAPDLPGYGLTRVPNKNALVYDDWRRVAAAVVEAERRRSSKPLVLFGLSMGGMLAYDAAARTGSAAGLVGTCFLDPRKPRVRRSMVRWSWMAPALGPLLTTAPAITDPIPIPMRIAGNMLAIANDPRLARTIASDPRAGGARMPAGYLRTFLTSEPAVDPETFDVCPVLLLHPAEDRWTDVSATLPFVERLNVEKQVVMLEGVGHFPVEEPGLTQLEDRLLAFLDERS